MSKNDNSYINDKKSYVSCKITKKNNNNNIKNTTEQTDVYKEFFQLTFLCFKLNCLDFEPFIYVFLY